MRLAALTLVGALGLTVAATANAAPAVPNLDQHNSNIVQVWGGCGPGMRPVPGHWSRWRGGWVPPHCSPMRYGYGGGYGGGGFYGGGYGGGYYGGGNPYWHRQHYTWGY